MKASVLLVQWNWGPKDARNWFHHDSIPSGEWNPFDLTGEWLHEASVLLVYTVELGSKRWFHYDSIPSGEWNFLGFQGNAEKNVCSLSSPYRVP